jgi:hypothetical protein
MFPEMCWDTVVITSQVIIARVSIGVGMILGPKKVFNLFHCGVEFDPAKTFRVLDSTIVDSVLRKPSLDGVNTFC